MDITIPPSRQFLTFLSGYCEDIKHKERMMVLATESAAYEDWRHNKLPHLLEVFDEFSSCKPPAALFVAHLMTLQPRFYSISSSQKKYPNEVHLTVAIVKYQTNGELSNLEKFCNLTRQLQPTLNSEKRNFCYIFKKTIFKRVFRWKSR